MYGFTQYAVAQVGIERLFRDNLDSPAQKVFKVEDETRREPRAGGRTGIDEKIDITLGPGVAACDRAKDPDIVGAMSSGNMLDVVPLLAQKLLETPDACSFGLALCCPWYHSKLDGGTVWSPNYTIFMPQTMSSSSPSCCQSSIPIPPPPPPPLFPDRDVFNRAAAVRSSQRMSYRS